MIQWHCADAWIGGPLRDGEAFRWTRIVGGFAAPLFLLLAGVSAALVFRPDRVWSGVRRGLGIVIGGYAFKLFAWAVDYGALVESRNWLAIALDAALLFALWKAVEEKAEPRRRVLLALLAAILWLGTWFALNDTTRTPSLVARLDVLQGIGASLVVVNGVLYAAARLRTATAVLALLAIVVALATPSFVGVDLSYLPTRVADYVARTTSDPMSSGARFPLFPWLAYTLLGAAIGHAVRARSLAAPWDVPFLRSGALALVIGGALSVALFEPMPTAQWILVRSEQSRNLVRLLWNASVAISFAGLGSVLLPRLLPLQRAVLSLGRHSLVVYVVHLEISWGLLCSPIRQTFGFGAWAVGTALLLASMIALAAWLDAREARPKVGDAIRVVEA